jgi:hypothetical protein
MIQRSLLTCLILSTLLHVHPALACGGFFTQDVASTAAMNAQQALMVVRSDRVELTLRVAAETVDSNLVWVVPIPAVDQVSLGDPEIFDDLDELTRPQITVIDHSGGSDGGCMPCLASVGGGDKAGGAPGSNTTVQHLGGGKVGNYEYDILAGTSAADMVTWLADADYVVPEGTADVLQPYADSGMQFLWAKINTESLEDDALILDPLRLDIPYTGPPVLTYPLTLSALSASPITSVLIYVLANERFHVSNFSNMDLSEVVPVVKAQWDNEGVTDLEAAVDTLTAEADGQLAITDFSQDVGDWDWSPVYDLVDEHAHVLTRLYLRVPSIALGDLTLTGKPDGEPVSQRHYASRQPTPLYFAHMGFFVLTLVGFRAFMRRRFRVNPGSDD